jgi:hypothetical protein
MSGDEKKKVEKITKCGDLGMFCWDFFCAIGRKI